MKNTLEDLRNHLFAALEGLADTEKPLDLERAKAISQVGQTIIETAKIEVKYLEVTGSDVNGRFFPQSEGERAERTRRELEAGRRQ